jgi:hypothetical protein
MVPHTCVGNRDDNEYFLAIPTNTMGVQVNLVSHYEQWLKEVNTDLTNKSLWAGDPPPIVFNLPSHLLAHTTARGNGGSGNECPSSQND